MKAQADGEDYLRDIMDDLRAEGTPYSRALLVHFGEPIRLPRFPVKWHEGSLNKFVKDMRKYANDQLSFRDRKPTVSGTIAEFYPERELGLTADSLATFKLYAEDAVEWSGNPWVSEGNIEVTKAMRGNLSDLVQKGFIVIEDYGSHEGSGKAHNHYIVFTDKGVKLATQLGIDLGGDYAQHEVGASLPADPLADLDVQIVIGQIEQLR